MHGHWLLFTAITLIAPCRGWADESSPARVELDKPTTKIESKRARRQLLGRHHLALQWISWKRYGQVEICDDQGLLHLAGKQSGKQGELLELDGVITRVARREFTFQGKILSQVPYLNKGKPCQREGEVTFQITKRRRYWRLKEMDSPCGDHVDYVDIFFGRPAKKSRRLVKSPCARAAGK